MLVVSNGCLPYYSTHARPTADVKMNVVLKTSFEVAVPVYVQTSDKTGFLSHSLTLSFTHSRHAEQLLFSCLCSKVALSLSHSLTLTLSHSCNLAILHSCTLALSHSHTLSFTLSRLAEQLLFSCLGSKVTLTLSHSFSLSHSFNLSFTHTLSISHSLTLDMLNKFCFHLYAQKSLFN